MSKRSNFDRVDRDFYPTPEEAVLPLLPHLPNRCMYTEPCVGGYDLVKHLSKYGHECMLAYDDGVDARYCEELGGDFFITNPPWDRKILHPIIENLSDIAPTWLLFDADWMHTKQSIPFIRRLVKIVSIGRVRWFPETKMTGKDNCCWYLFDNNNKEETKFYGRN